MIKTKYIVTKKQIMDAVKHGISEVISDPTINSVIAGRIYLAVETVLEDDCDEYIGGEQNEYAQIDCPINQTECDESCEYYNKLLLKCPLK